NRAGAVDAAAVPIGRVAVHLGGVAHREEADVVDPAAERAGVAVHLGPAAHRERADVGAEVVEDAATVADTGCVAVHLGVAAQVDGAAGVVDPAASYPGGVAV